MKLPDIFHHQLKRLSSGEYDDLLDKKELAKTLQKYMKLNKQLAVKFGNDIKKIKK